MNEIKVVIAGGSGFIGQKLTNFLLEKGHEIIILTRKTKEHPLENVSYVEWLNDGDAPENSLENVDVFINLAGVSINDGRWSKKHQERIYQSGMIATKELIRIISTLLNKPSTLINASAVGIYPQSLHHIYTEESLEVANDFLGKTVKDWEETAKQAEQFGVRTAFMRFGVVLGKGASALSLMTLPYKLFAGGTVGSGKQWVSWVHEMDVIRVIEFAIENPKIRGPVNVTAPSPMRMKEFGQTIGAVLKRPHWVPAPAFAIKIALGEKSKLVLEGQQVQPKVLLDEGFTFKFPTLKEALKDLLIK
ncbi:hypothetical protein SAMN05877842_10726 [Ureibacillus acetophenoni]|uniref:TIGR01777 family protein n=1 Tax=Ureibacillus acetophenoni TaxID=614649 RepID=A0A285UF80_9BACL|nr:hypothetical protein SAMN05877842_10726 [Ureibacillus acetophenoni]